MRSVYAERVTTGYFLDIDVKREEAARYGLSVEDVQEVIESAIGGMNLTTTIEGRERYPVNVRYARELRGDIEQLKKVLVPLGGMGGAASRRRGPGCEHGTGRQPDQAPQYLPRSPQSSRVPLGQLADIKVVRGPTSIKSEEGLLTAYVYVDFSGRDVGGFVNEAKKSVASLKIPEGYRLEWSGEYEYLVKTARASEARHTPYPPHHLRSHLLQHQVGDKDDHRAPCRALLPGRLLLVPLSARLQHEHRRMGGHHRAGWP